MERSIRSLLFSTCLLEGSNEYCIVATVQSIVEKTGSKMEKLQLKIFMISVEKIIHVYRLHGYLQPFNKIMRQI